MPETSRTDGTTRFRTLEGTPMVYVLPFTRLARTPPSQSGPCHAPPAASDATAILRAGRLSLLRHNDVLDALAWQETGLVWFHDRPAPPP